MRRRLSRRECLMSFGTASVAGAAMYGWATRVEPHWLEVTRHPLVLENLPVALQGKTLVQISDLHIGSTNETYLRTVMQSVNELAPDILAITGDLIDHHFDDSSNAIRRVLSELAPASIQTVACLGNHDYGRRWRQLEVADQVTRATEESGVRVLRNERIEIAGMDVLGIEDFWSPNFRTENVLQQADPGRASLALCHNPDVGDLPIWGQFRGAILSGHTHGGQCQVPFMGPIRLPVRNRRYVNGFYELPKGRILYVNRGVGYGYKARFNCRPEVTAFRLTA